MAMLTRIALVVVALSLLFGHATAQDRKPIVTVLGPVRNSPAKIPYTAGMTLADAVAAAGGFTPMVKTGRIRVLRWGRNIWVTPQPNEHFQLQPFLLQPGDIVIVTVQLRLF